MLLSKYWTPGEPFLARPFSVRVLAASFDHKYAGQHDICLTRPLHHMTRFRFVKG